MKIVGASAKTTILDGGARGRVINITSTSARVTLSKVTIQNGFASPGGGVKNSGTLTISNSTLTANHTSILGSSSGGGIFNTGTLTISNTTLSGNSSPSSNGGGGGVYSSGPGSTVTINNSTFSGNTAAKGGGIDNVRTFGSSNVTINNSTFSGNKGGIDNVEGGVFLQNSIIANNTIGNCSGAITSNGYNLSSDSTCNFNGPGDLNNTDPMLGPLQNNGGPTQTQALLSGSPAIDAGNPNGCTDGNGNLLKTDQRGAPRPDKEDTSGCDMGAYESQTD